MTLFRSAALLMGSACLMPLKGGKSVKGQVLYNRLYPNMFDKACNFTLLRGCIICCFNMLQVYSATPHTVCFPTEEQKSAKQQAMQ